MWIFLPVGSASKMHCSVMLLLLLLSFNLLAFSWWCWYVDIVIVIKFSWRCVCEGLGVDFLLAPIVTIMMIVSGSGVIVASHHCIFEHLHINLPSFHFISCRVLICSKIFHIFYYYFIFITCKALCWHFPSFSTRS